MSELLQKLAECIEFGKINKAAPYPPQMKGWMVPMKSQSN